MRYKGVSLVHAALRVFLTSICTSSKARVRNRGRRRGGQFVIIINQALLYKKYIYNLILAYLIIV